MPRVTAASVAREDLRCKLIARNGVGYDTVDVAALATKGGMTVLSCATTIILTYKKCR